MGVSLIQRLTSTVMYYCYRTRASALNREVSLLGGWLSGEGSIVHYWIACQNRQSCHKVMVCVFVLQDRCDPVDITSLILCLDKQLHGIAGNFYGRKKLPQIGGNIPFFTEKAFAGCQLLIHMWTQIAGKTLMEAINTPKVFNCKFSGYTVFGQSTSQLSVAANAVYLSFPRV